MRGIVFKGNSLLVMRRDKFGKQYYTLPGGGVDIGETTEQTLQREMREETGLKLGDARLVFIEDAGEPYGTQYIYLIDYIDGEPQLSPDSTEAGITSLGKNIYQPGWLAVTELTKVSFISERIRQAILKSLQAGFPDKAVNIS